MLTENLEAKLQADPHIWQNSSFEKAMGRLPPKYDVVINAAREHIMRSVKAAVPRTTLNLNAVDLLRKKNNAKIFSTTPKQQQAVNKLPWTKATTSS